jgi:hypothetical protein
LEVQMSEADLARLWRQTEAPARDLVFELGVDEAIARRELMIDFANLGAVAVAAAALLLAVGPSLLTGAGGLAASFDAAGPVLAAVAVIGGAMLWLGRVPDEA